MSFIDDMCKIDELQAEICELKRIRKEHRKHIRGVNKVNSALRDLLYQYKKQEMNEICRHCAKPVRRTGNDST